jgi:hypothetical protein
MRKERGKSNIDVELKIISVYGSQYEEGKEELTFSILLDASKPMPIGGAFDLVKPTNISIYL